MKKLAALLTCHNRKDTTLACLSVLMRQSRESCVIKVYLVDDGSIDGTAEAVREQLPGVHLITGDGSLYWCGGMRKAWSEAAKQNYDFYLWLNDDTHLYPSAVPSMLASLKSVGGHGNADSPAIIVGSTQNSETGELTYGGYIQAKPNSLDLRAVIPSDVVQACDTFNGNCVLISRAAYQTLGNLSTEFTHAMGDTDYGLRAKYEGIPMWVAPGYVGTCNKNPSPPWLDGRITLKSRISHLRSPKGLPPMEWMTFCKRHLGWKWPISTAKLFLRVLVPNTWQRLKSI